MSPGSSRTSGKVAEISPGEGSVPGVAGFDEPENFSAEKVKAILEGRARVLATVPPKAPLASEVLNLAVFELAGERYALETRFVRRIGRLGHYTPVPGAPSLLLGVFNSGGEIIPLIDLAVLFGVGGDGPTSSSLLVVLGEDHEEFGLLVDKTDEVLVIRLEEILPPTAVGETEGRSLIRGVTEDALIVIDGEQLLADPRLMIDQGLDA
ncbi:chemotaxis protein CheW [Singulisphaera sp. PoT]|uniref:chemotaxis protein CheW n=1 Tax=Singulisphaera sp. PoT TaxID=3411797 RepID=UPI003BF52B0F